jgi:ATP-dependent protease ClpP protease subunit
MKSLLFAIITTISLAGLANTNIKLSKDNFVILRQEVTEQSISKLELELTDKVAKRGNKDYPIYLLLDSPGGSIDAGLSFIEFAKTIPNLHTITIFAASMASGIVESLPGTRNIINSGILMFHRAKGGVQGQFEDGELESRLGIYKRIVVNLLEQTNADRLKLSLTEYKSKVKDELWIGGFEAVEQKAADTKVNIECSSELVTDKQIETFLIGGLFPVKVAFSGCPLVRGGEVVDKNFEAKYNEYRSEKWSIGNKSK